MTAPHVTTGGLCRWKAINKEGRHVGLDFYDLLIEGDSTNSPVTVRAGYNNAHHMALISGTKLGPYEILAPLGAGGMGEVYRARDTRLGRDVALKITSRVFRPRLRPLRRFEQEARAVAALNHPNILAHS